MASLVRANIRSSLASSARAANGSNDSWSTTDDEMDGDMNKKKKKDAQPPQNSFAGVAHQVVTSKRAARGFLGMWPRAGGMGSSQLLVYRGIHMEKKKLDLKTVASEYKEMKRRQFYQELIVYMVFLAVFFSLVAWLPVEDSYQQNDVVGALTCREEGVCDVHSFSDLYEFAETIKARVCGDDSGESDAENGAQWTRVGDVRFRQVRVRKQQCRIYDGWVADCYPFYSASVEQKAPIVGADASRTYTWQDGLGQLRPHLSHTSLLLLPLTWATTTTSASSIATTMTTATGTSTSTSYELDYGTGGYAVDLCAASVSELQEDGWLSPATRALSVEFTLLNPVTRVFTIGLHVFTMHPSGHLEHFAHSSHLRVVGLERNEIVYVDDGEGVGGVASGEGAVGAVVGAVYKVFDVVRAAREWVDGRVALWAALVLFFATYCMGEAAEMATMGVGTYLYSDMWNLFELTHLAILASVLVWAVRYYLASWAFAAHFDALLRSGQSGSIAMATVAGNSTTAGDVAAAAGPALDHSSLQGLLTTFQQLADLASVAAAFSVLKVFKFLRMNSTLNLLWRVLGMALRDLMGFLVIFNLIFLGYSAMGSFAFGFALEEFSTIGRSYGTCFSMLAGEMDYARLRQANPRLAPVFIGSFVVLVFQILVNMFVAILSEYYEVAKNGSDGEEDGGDGVEYDVLARLRSYWQAVSPTVVMAHKKDVIRLVPRQTVRLISTNLVDQEEMRQRARKLFRGAVWRVVALLRFGMKFDRRIQFGDRKAHAHAAGGGGGGGANGVPDKDAVTHIRLSENFDHQTIKDMIPIGITVRLQGDSLLGDGLALKVVHHNKLSVECVVLGSNDDASDDETDTEWDDEGFEEASGEGGARRGGMFAPPRTLSSLGSFEDSDADGIGAVRGRRRFRRRPRERVLELLGGEKLRIPWQHLAYHVARTFVKELKVALLQATKLWSYSKTHRLVDDYHLGLLFNSVLADGRESLRFDEISRMLDLYLRKDKRRALCSQSEVRQEALDVMYRFRMCLIDMPSREKEGHNYRPKPVDTSKVELGHLEHLGDMLARNCHDMWALERLKQGWQYGPKRDDASKKHPNLIPYKLLSVEEQAFDYRSSVETLKTIVFMNYTIVRASHAGSSGGSGRNFSRSASMMSAIDDGGGVTGGSSSSLVNGQHGSGNSASFADALDDDDDDRESLDGDVVANGTGAAASSSSSGKSKPAAVPSLLREAMSFRRSSLMEDSPYYTTYGVDGVEIYRPLPIDTSNVELPPRLLRLVDLLAENAHEVWSKGRMDAGWTYGPARDDPAKKHPCLVPYVFLTDDEKEYDINIARETLKTLLAMRFSIIDRSSKY